MWAVWVTCVVDGVDHAVTDEDMSAGMAVGQGKFTAVCGVLVTPDALSAPPGRMCLGCWVGLCPVVNTQRAVVPVARRHRRHRRPGWLRMWVASVFAAPSEAGTSRTVRRQPAERWVWPS
jgi:hypothetical protein